MSQCNEMPDIKTKDLYLMIMVKGKDWGPSTCFPSPHSHIQINTYILNKWVNVENYSRKITLNSPSLFKDLFILFLFYTCKCFAYMYAYASYMTLISQRTENSVFSSETNIVIHHIFVEELTRSSAIEEIAHNCWAISPVPDVIIL